jgi:hypothetical protein
MLGGGVYLWASREAADRQYSATWKSMIAEKSRHAAGNYLL